MAKTKKITLHQAAQRLTKIAEEVLSRFPEHEQEERLAKFERTVARLRRGNRGTFPKRRHTEKSRASVRGPR